MEPRMGDISEFAAEAASEFLESQKNIQPRFNLNLQRDAVEAFIRGAYYASLIPNEGRYPVVQLMSYRSDNTRACTFPFETPLNPAPAEIARLAHAVGPASHICFFCNQGKIKLGGIQITVLNEMREFGYSSFRIGNPFRIRIRGPGFIEMSTGGIALVYNAGMMTEESLLQHSETLSRLCTTIEPEVAPLTRGVVESLGDVINDVCEEIVRGRHGGMVLFMRQLDESHISSVRRVQSPLLQELMVNYWNTVADYQGERQNLGGGPESHVENRYSVELSSQTAIVEKGVAAVADMAGMDGAIVFDYGFRVIALNAFVNRAPITSQLSPRLADAAGRSLRPEDIVGGRGSRHQSALSFAMQTSMTFAFVISQDGGISAFHNDGEGNVYYEGPLRVLD